MKTLPEILRAIVSSFAAVAMLGLVSGACQAGSVTTTASLPQLEMSGTSDSNSLTTGVPQFIGSGPLERVAFPATGESLVGGGVKITAALPTLVRPEIRVARFNPAFGVPEPSSIVMGLIGAGVVVGLAVRHRRVATA
jgi:hypothetical protein